MANKVYFVMGGVWIAPEGCLLVTDGELIRGRCPVCLAFCVGEWSSGDENAYFCVECKWAGPLAGLPYPPPTGCLEVTDGEKV